MKTSSPPLGTSTILFFRFFPVLTLFLAATGALIPSLTAAKSARADVDADAIAQASSTENTPERFQGSDIERINAAIADAPRFGGHVRIPPRKPDAESDRNYWLIDSAILVPGDTTLVFDNCKVKLSDSSRDNILRTANCGLGINHVEPIGNVHIAGIGNAVLEGSDIPRSSGDRGKVLWNGTYSNEQLKGSRPYGSDAGREGEWQKEDFRNFGLLLVKVHDFTLSGITVRQPHSYAINFERCTHGKISDIHLYAVEERTLGGSRSGF